jgi:hypothetical protein
MKQECCESVPCDTGRSTDLVLFGNKKGMRCSADDVVACTTASDGMGWDGMGMLSEAGESRLW